MARRRQSAVHRNLDDPLKFLGVLSFRSARYCVMLALFSYSTELTTGLWSFVFGVWGSLAQTGGVVALGMALCAVETYEDEHLAPSAIRYALSGRWRGIYSPAVLCQPRVSYFAVEQRRVTDALRARTTERMR